MVTLRRDVAAANSNRVFDRVEKETLTDYDIFMQQKRMGEISRSYGQATISTNSFVQDDYGNFCAPQGNPEEDKREVFDSYDDYMRKQLDRKNGNEKLLSLEEYCAIKYNEAKGKSASSKKTRKEKGVRGLTKIGKIFIGVYVLVTVAVASTILALNLGSGESVKTKANADANEGITALAMEFEEEENNWFDSMCDSLSNK